MYNLIDPNHRAWVWTAPCRNHPWTMWEIPAGRLDHTQITTIRKAVKICDTCPVITECSADAQHPVDIVLAGVVYNHRGEPLRRCRGCRRPIVGRTVKAEFCTEACRKSGRGHAENAVTYQATFPRLAGTPRHPALRHAERKVAARLKRMGARRLSSGHWEWRDMTDVERERLDGVEEILTYRTHIVVDARRA